MKLLSIQAELKALRTMCAPGKLGSLMLASCKPEHFYYNPAKSAFTRILQQVRAEGGAPTWAELISDLTISEEHRRVLSAHKEPPEKNYKSVVRVLSKYAKLRGLINLANGIMDAVEEKTLDLDSLIDTVSDQLTTVRIGSAKAKLWHFGHGNNSSSLIKDMLNSERPPVVPTGFEAFDKVNSGILDGSLFTIGAPTGGGKTALGVNLLDYMTGYGHSCCIVPLEMTPGQTADRLMGMNADIPVNKISQRRLSKGEKAKVKKTYAQWVKQRKETGTRWSIFDTDEDMTIEEILFSLKPHKYKVILIDYISLLKGVDGDDQWRQLGNVARFAKMFAKTTGCIVVLLCQVSEDGRIRYAQSIAEHSNNTWILSVPKETADTMIIDVNQMKARNQAKFAFQLFSNNQTMRIKDVPNEVYQDNEGSDQNGKSDNQDTSYLSDINEEDED